MGKDPEKNMARERSADSALAISCPRSETSTAANREAESRVHKEQEKNAYLEEKFGIQVQSGSVYTYKVRHLPDGLMYSPCSKISKDGTTHEVVHYAYACYDAVSDESIRLRCIGMSNENVLEQMARLIGELKKEDYRGPNGRMVYLDRNGKLLSSPRAKASPTVAPRYVDAQGNRVQLERASEAETKPVAVGKEATSVSTPDSTHAVIGSETVPETPALGSYRKPEPRIPPSKYEGQRGKTPKLPKEYQTLDSSAAADVVRKPKS